jgi:four helix bundle protein
MGARVAARKGAIPAIAQGSLAETETFLTLCEEIGWLSPSKTEALWSLLGDVRKMLTSLRRKFRSES